MITRDVAAFVDVARTVAPDFGPATPQAAFLVAPDGFRLAEQSARDNAYMADATAFDAARASAQHRDLHRAISAVVPTVCFAGDPATRTRCFPTTCSAPRPGAASSAACAIRCASAKRPAPISARSSATSSA